MELLKENEDYTLVPLDEHEDAWGVRLDTGPFPETIILFGAIGFNKIQDKLTFNFDVYSSPDPDLTPQNEELQERCALVLEDIIVNGVEDGTVELKDPNASES